MADYKDLYDLYSDTELKKKIAMALTVASENISNNIPPSSKDEIAWTKRLVANPDAEAVSMLSLFVARNRDLDIGDITSMSDQDIQDDVNSLIEILILSN